MSQECGLLCQGCSHGHSAQQWGRYKRGQTCTHQFRISEQWIESCQCLSSYKDPLRRGSSPLLWLTYCLQSSGRVSIVLSFGVVCGQDNCHPKPGLIAFHDVTSCTRPTAAGFAYLQLHPREAPSCQRQRVGLRRSCVERTPPKLDGAT